jgi:integrase/recombinase XerD
MTTPLRAKYIRDLTIRGRAERTQQSYSRYVSELARYYHRSPELISYQEVADWLYYLIKERELRLPALTRLRGFAAQKIIFVT